MAVQLSAVAWWWKTPDGVGHALAWDTACTCGQCDLYGSLCGRTGSDGEITRFRPDRVCEACLEVLATPKLVARPAGPPVILIRVMEVNP